MSATSTTGSESRGTQFLLPGLVWPALSTAVIGSLGLLLIPTIARELHVTVGSAQWVLTISLLVGAVATPVAGRLSDGRNPRRLLIVMLATILVGSILAATTTSFAQLLAGRALQGLSYAVIPVTITLMRRNATPENAAGGISALSVTAATGVGLGYPVTGIIAASTDFRFAFWFATLFVASAIVVVLIAVPASIAPATTRTRFDYLGAILIGLGLAALLLAISEGPTWSWSSGWIIGLFITAAVLLTAWVLVEVRAQHPLIRLGVLRHGDVLLANGTAIGLGAAMYIGLSLISLIGQADTSTGYGLGLPLFWAGFVMLPLSIGSQAATRIARVLTRRLSTTALLPIGAACVTIATAFLTLQHDQLWEILTAMLVFGLGIGTTFAAMPGLISRSVVVAELGSAVSFNQVLRTIGGSIGSAIAAAILAAHTSPTGLAADSGITTAFTVSSAACALVLIGLLVHAAHTRHTAIPRAGLSPQAEAGLET